METTILDFDFQLLIPPSVICHTQTYDQIFHSAVVGLPLSSPLETEVATTYRNPSTIYLEESHGFQFIPEGASLTSKQARRFKTIVRCLKLKASTSGEEGARGRGGLRSTMMALTSLKAEMLDLLVYC